MVKRERHVVIGKVPQAYFISFLVGFIKDLGFRRTILKCDNEPSSKALQDAVIHACVGVEVIPQGPPEGDHMARPLGFAGRGPQANHECASSRA